MSNVGRSTGNDNGTQPHQLENLLHMLCLEDQACRPQLSSQISSLTGQLSPSTLSAPESLSPPVVNNDVTESLPAYFPNPQFYSADTAALGRVEQALIHDSVVCSVCYSWDGQYLATASNNATNMFETKTGHKLATFSEQVDFPCDGDISYNERTFVRTVCFTPDGHWLVAGGEDCVLRVWGTDSGTLRYRIVGDGGCVSAVDTSSNNQFMVSGYENGQVKAWELERGNLLTSLCANCDYSVTSVSISPTCQHVATGSVDGVVRVWDLESATIVRQFEDHSQSVYSVTFSPDGSRVLSGSLDSTSKMWDLNALSNPCVLSITGHNDSVLCVACSPDGRLLISGSKDRTVQLRDHRQPSLSLELRDHKNSVIAVAHHPKFPGLATGCGDRSARIWQYSF